MQQILAERLIDGVLWRAQTSADRGRLEVIAIVPASQEPTVVKLLRDSDLRDLLAEGADQNVNAWICAECGAANARGMRWCRQCSGHTAA